MTASQLEDIIDIVRKVILKHGNGNSVKDAWHELSDEDKEEILRELCDKIYECLNQ